MPTTTTRKKTVRLKGYTAGAPPWADPNAVAVDAEVAASTWCEACQHYGLMFLPFHRSRPERSYRAVLVCSSCGHTEEL